MSSWASGIVEAERVAPEQRPRLLVVDLGVERVDRQFLQPDLDPEVLLELRLDQLVHLRVLAVVDPVSAVRPTGSPCRPGSPPSQGGLCARDVVRSTPSAAALTLPGDPRRQPRVRGVPDTGESDLDDRVLVDRGVERLPDELVVERRLLVVHRQPDRPLNRRAVELRAQRRVRLDLEDRGSREVQTTARTRRAW